MTSTLSRRWLLIGVWALAIAGLFSLVLVVARTPSLAQLPLFLSLFHQALVVHVDLSVLVWFLSIACLMWSLLASASRSLIPYLEQAAQYCFMGGMACIALSPLDSKAEAMMSNYIPVIHGPLFFLGLALLLCGVGLMLLRVFTAPQWSNVFSKPVQFGVFSSAIIALISLAAFFWSYRLLPPVISGQQYYEMLFWGGGHVLQFTHTQILLVCWLWLASALRPDFSPGRHWLYVLFSIGLLAALATPFAYFSFDITSPEFRNFFTQAMIAANGIAPALLALFIIPVLYRAPRKNALWAALLMSVVLFIYGGILAGMIRGQNVIIPAHYHGSIVGITLAFMGIAYLLLPRFGHRDVKSWRLAFWQPIIYGAGQIMHISGLAYSGGYGVLRKTPGAINEISLNIKIAMGFMGLGGLLAIIGGLLFVVVMWQAVRKR